MDPVILLVLVLFILLVLFALLTRREPPPGPDGPHVDDDGQTFTFDPEPENLQMSVRRKTVFLVPPQKIAGPGRQVQILLRPLPRPDGLTIPSGKGIDALDVLFLNPYAALSDTGEEVYDFDPPLTVTMYYTAEDAEKAARDEKGAPLMSIITGYESESGWKFERLPTTPMPDAETGGGTLKAPLTTLHPRDPMWAGRP